MKPAEFFDLTPGEVTRWLGSAWRGRIENAYWIDRIRRTKKLPSKPSDLFPPERKVLSGDQLHKQMKSVVGEFNRRSELLGATKKGKR